jgi:hypothetical protein
MRYLVTGLFLLLVTTSIASGEPLVDCADPAFKATSSARSLMLWSKEHVNAAKSQKAQGLDPEYQCGKAIEKLGQAHCKEPGDAEITGMLKDILGVCKKGTPAKSKEEGVDCSSDNFKHPKATVDQLLNWVDLALRSVKNPESQQRSYVKLNCERAFKSAGTAHCKLPADPRPKAALQKVRNKCAAAKTSFAKVDAKEEAKKAARLAQLAAAKKNRKKVKFPRSTFKGSGAKSLRKKMKTALVKGRIAKKAGDVLKVQPMGRWKSGFYAGTRTPYKKIMGTVLWRTKEKDGICRFTSFNFIKDKGRKGWSPLRFKSFCNGCPEGWTRCKK